MKTYIFQSARLGFRKWLPEDLDEFAALNSDKDVMEHFPKTATKEETRLFMDRLNRHCDERAYTYFATDVLETGEFIGFVGLLYQTYESEFTPATDIGWRLKKSAWGKGYATEGAKRCLTYGFKELDIERIVSVCASTNTKSENVMRKIGMVRKGSFKHPKLKAYPRLEKCIWYEILNE